MLTSGSQIVVVVVAYHAPQLHATPDAAVAPLEGHGSCMRSGVETGPQAV